MVTPMPLDTVSIAHPSLHTEELILLEYQYRWLIEVKDSRYNVIIMIIFILYGICPGKRCLCL